MNGVIRRELAGAVKILLRRRRNIHWERMSLRTQNRADGILRCLDFFLTQTIPIFMFILLCFSFVYDPHSGWVRLAFFLFGFVVSLNNIRHGFYLILTTCLWFEAPTYFWGLPNQFLIEATVIGLLLAISVRTVERKLVRDLNSEDLFFPSIFPLFFVIVFSLFATTVSLAELYTFGMEGFSKSLFFKNIVRQGFYWDVRSPVHQYSYILGCLILLCFTVQLLKWRSGFQRKSLIYCLLLGSIPVTGYGILQWLLPSLPRMLYLSDPTGTLQNGNHLSLYSGIIALLGFRYLFEIRGQKQPLGLWVALIPIVLALTAFVIGHGKGAWVSFAGSMLVIGFLTRAEGLGRTLKKIAFWLVPILLLVIAFFSVTGIDSVVGFADRVLGEYRYTAFLKAFTIVDGHWLTGVGLGNYFMRSGGDYDIHNLFLSWLVETGLLSVLVLAGSYFFFFETLLQIFSR